MYYESHKNEPSYFLWTEKEEDVSEAKDGEVLTCSKVWDHTKHSLPSLGLYITEKKAVSLLQRGAQRQHLDWRWDFGQELVGNELSHLPTIASLIAFLEQIAPMASSFSQYKS